MEPMNDWPETVALLCKWWPELFWKDGAGYLYKQVRNTFPHHTMYDSSSLDSLAAISEAIRAVTWAAPSFMRKCREWVGFWFNSTKQGSIGYHNDEITARLAAVNAAVRYISQQEEKG